MTKLAEYMATNDLTDAAMAEKVGCDRSMITKLRHGSATPSLPLAIAISRETGIEAADLMPTPTEAPVAEGQAA